MAAVSMQSFRLLDLYNKLLMLCKSLWDQSQFPSTLRGDAKEQSSVVPVSCHWHLPVRLML